MSDSKFRGKFNPLEIVAFVSIVQTFLGSHRTENYVNFFLPNLGEINDEHEKKFYKDI